MIEAAKYDVGKPNFDLLPADALAEVQQVLDFGARKYAAWNWEKGFAWLRLWNATLRHLWAWVRGENNDPESGLSHIAHAACMVLFLLAHIKQGLGRDDRRLPVPPAEPPAPTSAEVELLAALDDEDVFPCPLSGIPVPSYLHTKDVSKQLWWLLSRPGIQNKVLAYLAKEPA